MKAATRSRYGDQEVITISEVRDPKPAHDEVLIKVFAATVNRTDCGLLSASPWIVRLLTGLFKPRSPFLGTDFAGEITEVGNGVSRYKIGDRVWGFDDSGIGSQAQFFTRKERKPMGIIPENISYDEAAAAPEGAHYAINFMNKVKISPEHKVLVNGATGAIGSAALQLLKSQGNHVTAVCGTENIERANEMGADNIIDFKKEDFTKSNDKYDFVFDAVGKSRFKKCKKILKQGGVYISSELGPGSENVLLAISTKFFGDKTVKFPIPLNVQESLDLIAPLLASGEFKPLIDRSYPLNEVKEAYRFVASGQKVGNVLLHPWA